MLSLQIANNDWVPVFAALVGGALAATSGLCVEVWRGRRDAKAHHQDDIRAAAQQLLNASLGVILEAQAMRLTITVRTGLVESLSIAARFRKPLDPLEIHDRMMAPFSEAGDAVARLWLSSDRILIDEAGRLLEACSRVMTVAVGFRARSGLGRADRVVRGIRWDAAEVAAWEHASGDLGPARARFADVVRSQLNAPDLDLAAMGTGDEPTPALSASPASTLPLGSIAPSPLGPVTVPAGGSWGE